MFYSRIMIEDGRVPGESADGAVTGDPAAAIVPEEWGSEESHLEASPFDEREAEHAAAEEWQSMPYEAPDSLDLVVETATMMAVFAAQRYERIDAMRRQAHEDAIPFRGGLPEIIERSLRAELAAGLRITEHAAERLMLEAEALVRRYPAMLESLGRARTTEQHASVFVEIVEPVEEELRERVVPQAVRLAETLPLGTFRRELRKLVETVRATTLEERHREAVKERRVYLTPSVDGMASVTWYGPAVEARAMHNRLTGMAKALAAEQGGETRTLDQLRADIMGDLLVDGHVAGHPKAVRGVRATIFATVPALSLLDDEIAAKSEPPTVEGVGPIPLSVARQLAGGAKGWIRVLTHPETGIALSFGRKKYKPPPELRRFVQWRAGRCLWPGCGMPAERCELDHTIAWKDGGPTDACNLCPLCAGHHTVKHHGGWKVRQLEGRDGAVEWTSPMGRVYVVEPERRAPVFRPALEPEGTPPF
jgi:hypothetical protein